MSKYDELRYEKEMIEYKIANRKICVPFTETEDLQLIKVLIPLPVGEWRNVDKKLKTKLSIALKRDMKSIGNRWDELRRRSPKIVKDRKCFSLEEDQIIIDCAIEVLVGGKSLQKTSIPFPKVINLATSLNRHHSSIMNRWNTHIKTWLLLHYAKTINFEIRPMLANVLADNFETLGAVDWTFVLTYPEFSGHTVKSLKRMFHVLRKNMCHKQKVGASEVSLKQVATFAEKSFLPRKLPKNIEKRQRELIDYFERQVNAKNIENFV